MSHDKSTLSLHTALRNEIFSLSLLSTMIILYISGPFPNFDPMSGPSQLLMATPVSPGATVIAVPMGCPPPHVKQVGGAPQHGLPGPAFHPVQPQHGLPGPAFHPVQPHMLHWDCQHPAGQIVSLRQPSGPVYYNVPASHTSSGLQSPNSEGRRVSTSTGHLYRLDLQAAGAYPSPAAPLVTRRARHSVVYIPWANTSQYLLWWDSLRDMFRLE